MKTYKITLQLSLVALALAGFGAAHAAEVQYDFLTDVSIAVNSDPFVSVNNGTLSLVIDWYDVDDTGPTTIAEGSLVSITASFDSNVTGFDSVLLNDNTISSLSPHFSTVGLNTSTYIDAATAFTNFASPPLDAFLTLGNFFTASDPFGSNPILDGGMNLIAYDQEGVIRDRDYYFAVSGSGIGGVYEFDESILNSFFDLSSWESGSESVNIRYQVGQYLGSGAVVPVPAAAPLGLLGMGIVGWFSCRRRKVGALDE